jgi:DNA repair exonuclease SbcCD ATPase subunit
MLNKLILTNFGKFQSREVNFTEGLNVMLGANEAGKSTLLAAIVYAWFGANALELPLAEYIHWGEHPNSLKVELWQTVGGVLYHVKRGPSGAEIRYADQSVTGQVEVTRFFEKLLGTRAAVASRLFVAAQSDLRGVAAGSGTVASQLIERLSNLDTVDALISDVENNNPHGDVSDRLLAINAAQAELASIDLSAPDTAPMDAQLLSVRSQLDVKATDIATVNAQIESNRAALARQTRELGISQAEISSHNAAVAAAAERAQEVERLEASLEAVPAFPKGHKASLDARREARDLTRTAKRQYDDMVAFNVGVEKLHWPTLPDGVGLLERYEFCRARRLAQEELQKELNREANVKRGQMITSTACGLCGKDLRDVPEVVTTNARLTAEVEALEARVKEAQRAAVLAGTDEAAITLFDREWSDLTARYPANKMTLCVTVPGEHGTHSYRWDRSTDFSLDPRLEEDTEYYTTMTAQHRHIAVSLENARTLLAKAAAARDAERKQRSPAQIEADMKVTNDRITQLSSELARLSADSSTLRSQQAQATAERAALITAYGVRKDAAKRCQQQIELHQGAVAKVQTANGLLLALKKAKPILTEQIWDACLAAIGQYFSSVRGEQSRITRADGKFLINLRTAAAHSGSTKDALGLAIRIALTQVFVPGTPLMILDEPGAACDNGREAAMLGVIASAGFKQVLLVTHSEVANAHAANIIKV